jgi:hypothetical protein
MKSHLTAASDCSSSQILHNASSASPHAVSPAINASSMRLSRGVGQLQAWEARRHISTYMAAAEKEVRGRGDGAGARARWRARATRWGSAVRRRHPSVCVFGHLWGACGSGGVRRGGAQPVGQSFGARLSLPCALQLARQQPQTCKCVHHAYCTRAHTNTHPPTLPLTLCLSHIHTHTLTHIIFPGASLRGRHLQPRDQRPQPQPRPAQLGNQGPRPAPPLDRRARRHRPAPDQVGGDDTHWPCAGAPRGTRRGARKGARRGAPRDE